MTIVVKLGGNAIAAAAGEGPAAAVAALVKTGYSPVVVHGGGPMIARALKRAGIATRFVRGLRVTTAESLPVVEAELTLLGKRLAQGIGRAVGLTGRDDHLLVAETLDADLGHVGRVTAVNGRLLVDLLSAGITPVVACLAETADGRSVLNVNADSAASAIAGALCAPVLFLTNVPGVLDDPNDATSLLADLSAAEVAARLSDGRIAGGMIPKVEAALEALERGAAYAVIADGRTAGALAEAVAGRSGTRLYR